MWRSKGEEEVDKKYYFESRKPEGERQGCRNNKEERVGEVGKESGLESRGSTVVLVTPKDQLSGLACLQPRTLGKMLMLMQNKQTK